MDGETIYKNFLNYLHQYERVLRSNNLLPTAAKFLRDKFKDKKFEPGEIQVAENNNPEEYLEFFKQKMLESAAE